MFNNWLIPFKGRQDSGQWDQNFLWKHISVYIMDNHRAALWCWLQHFEENEMCDLLHIDRHYDVLPSHTNVQFLKELELKKISINDYLAIEVPSENGAYKVIRWDNYLYFFLELYGTNIGKRIFATHDIGDQPKFEFELIPPWNLPDYSEILLSKGKNRWIVNIDLDYFFCRKESNLVRMFSNNYIESLFGIIHKKYQNNEIKVLTIALSPECCGGWEPAEHLCQKICTIMDLEFTLP